MHSTERCSLSQRARRQTNQRLDPGELLEGVRPATAGPLLTLMVSGAGCDDLADDLVNRKPGTSTVDYPAEKKAREDTPPPESSRNRSRLATREGTKQDVALGELRQVRFVVLAHLEPRLASIWIFTTTRRSFAERTAMRRRRPLSAACFARAR
jgi:hypothetical protein